VSRSAWRIYSIEAALKSPFRYLSPALSWRTVDKITPLADLKVKANEF
jgi:3-oxoacyl-[acyl-carrier protein] reductase